MSHPNGLARRSRRWLLVAAAALAALAVAAPASANTISRLDYPYKTAEAHGKRVWTWTIDKSVTPESGEICVEPTERTLAGSPTVCRTSRHTYTIKLTRESRETWKVSGEACVKNTGWVPTRGLRIEDQLQASNDGRYWWVVRSAWLNTAANPVLDPGEKGCYPYRFGFEPEKGVYYRNVAFFIVDNALRPTRRENPYGTPSTGERYQQVAWAPIRIGDPYEVNERVYVEDTFVSGTISFPREGAQPLEYTYAKTFDRCPRTFVNTATLFDEKDRVIDYDEASVRITCMGNPPPPPPEDGCTYTQGYWKNHSREGNAPYDPAWQNIGALEEDTPFFDSGQTWYEVFHTPPAGGNAYYQLAHQYMAAILNILNDADPTTAVQDALSDAEALFMAQGANDTTLNATETTNARAWAEILDDYNNGRTGPGHCK